MAHGKLELLAGQGDAYAQFSLGIMYAKGVGVAKDEVEAFRWFRKAAEQGYAGAQLNLGKKYINGDGVQRDDVQAHMWFDLAAGHGNEEARKTRNAAAKDMTPSQIEKARRLAREWKPTRTNTGKSR